MLAPLLMGPILAVNFPGSCPPLKCSLDMYHIFQGMHETLGIFFMEASHYFIKHVFTAPADNYFNSSSKETCKIIWDAAHEKT